MTTEIQDGRTCVDGLVEIPRMIIDEIYTMPEVIRLLADNPTATLSDIEDSDGRVKYIYDYEYVDETVEEAAAFICVDALPVDITNQTTMPWDVYIHIICHKNFMTTNKRKFKGMRGNRRDNLALLLASKFNGSRNFGIGTLNLVRISKTSLPSHFTGRSLHFEVSDFNWKGLSNNDA